MFEITKEISLEEVLEKIEEAKNIGIVALIFAFVAIVLFVMLICLYFEVDKINDKKIAELDDLLAQEIEKNRALEYKLRFYCNSVTHLKSSDTKKGKKK